ncbi:MAG: hypothetical protein US57_C0013G0014 [Candidatus Moranbacteria bacterium GW2011_GWC2_37_73]|nr:MAG: hypothetical protein UR95_C0003G0086 [Parcubacteria group bacterium GW2011_GWC1_36_108]KKQ39434.1 MAG: hypothetical protein US57_C0013G0014 [Candidatus Moranbacteria bacterium GW2011_GWC2_37_73]HBU10636.1 hypothetical protein [Candidatus Moranbacteria bacterium]
MKKFLVSFVFIFLLVPMAQAFSVPEEVQVMPSPNTPVAYPEVSPSFTLGDVKKAVNKGMGRVNKKIAALKAEIIKKDTETAKSVDALGQKIDGQTSEIKKIGEGVKSLDNKLTGKGGEFEKSRNVMWSVGKELSDSIALYLVIAAVVIVVLGLVCFILLKKTLNRVEDKVDNIDVKIDDVPINTANRVNAFDRSPLNVVVSGHNVVFLQDEDTLNRKVYQILMVEDGVSSMDTPATYELQVRANRDKAEDSLRRTMREYFNGKLIAKTDPASILTLNLIKHYESTGKLSIVKLP